MGILQQMKFFRGARFQFPLILAISHRQGPSNPKGGGLMSKLTSRQVVYRTGEVAPGIGLLTNFAHQRL